MKLSYAQTDLVPVSIPKVYSVRFNDVPILYAIGISVEIPTGYHLAPPE